MAVKTWNGGPDEWRPQADEYTVTYEGLVLFTGEHNWHDDSDFYAMVWDAEAGEPREVGYASTRGWTYNNSATADATPEVQAAYDAWKARLAAERYDAYMAAEAAKVAKGREVRVVKGRKVPVGTQGTVIWAGEGRYGRRVGLKDADGTVHWTAESNVEVVATAGSPA
jgi:hypothetical protein